MANTRPYWLVYKGVEHIIEAGNPAAAVQHVVDTDITELRAARAAEVTAWIRAGKDIPIAGAKPVEKSAPDASPDSWKPSDEQRGELSSWLIGEAAADDTKVLIKALGKMFDEGHMSLESFDAIRGFAPAFETAILGAINILADPGNVDEHVDLEQVRGSLEEKPYPLSIVFGAFPIKAVESE